MSDAASFTLCDIATCLVEGNAVARRAAKQLMYRLAGVLAGNIPQCIVHSTERHNE